MMLHPTQELEPPANPARFNDAETVPATSDALKKLHLFAKKYREGKGFLRENGKTKSFKWAEFNLPLEDRAIVFSATNAFEGWHLDPKRRFPVTMVGEPTDYSQLQVEIVRRPAGMKAKWNKTLMKQRDDRGRVLGALRNAISEFDYHNEQVLVLVPKSVADWIRDNAMDEDTVLGHDNISLIHWGAGIGTNAYQDHKNMVVWGLFWPHADKMATDAVGHGVDASEVINNNSKAIQNQRSDHHSRWIIQMLNRMQIRQMEENLKAKPGKVIWVTTKKEEAVVREVLKKDFQGASVVSERSEDVFAKPMPKIISQVLAALKATKQDTITAPEMAKDRGVDFNQRGVAQTLKDHSEVFLEAGWTYMPATRGRSATPHRWFKT